MIDETIIYGTVLLLIFLASFYFISTFYNKRDKYDLTQVNLKKSKASDDLKRLLESCPNGMCAIDKQSGTKRCPSASSDSIIYDPSAELCTYPDSCPESIPYAVNADGSVNENGRCSTGMVCRCSKKATCSTNTVAKFVVKNGIPEVEHLGFKNYIISMEPSTNPNGAFNRLERDELAKEYCKINPAYTGRLSSGCDLSFNRIDPVNCKERDVVCSGATEGEAHYSSMIVCQADNPCPVGQLAYNVDNKDPKSFLQFNGKNIATYMHDSDFYTLGCSVGMSCTFETIPKQSIGLENQKEEVKNSGRFFPDFDYELSSTAITESGNNKTGVSLYQTVWDPQLYQTICVRPKPFLLARTIRTADKSVHSVIIEACGADFGHYIQFGDRYIHPTLGTDLEVKLLGASQANSPGIIRVDDITDGKITSISVVTGIKSSGDLISDSDKSVSFGGSYNENPSVIISSYDLP
jgi:hypothetical protein